MFENHCLRKCELRGKKPACDLNNSSLWQFPSEHHTIPSGGDWRNTAYSDRAVSLGLEPRLILFLAVLRNKTQQRSSSQLLVLPSKSVTTTVKPPAWRVLRSPLTNAKRADCATWLMEEIGVKHTSSLSIPPPPQHCNTPSRGIQVIWQRKQVWATLFSSLVRECTNPVNRFSSIQKKWPKPIPLPLFLPNAVGRNKIPSKDTCWRF